MNSSPTFGIYPVKKGGIKVNFLSIFIENEKKYISLTWLFKTIFTYGIVRINIYSRIDTVPNEPVWLVKNSPTERYISPHKSELSI